MAWLSLVLAGLFEIGWPVGLKLGWTENGVKPVWIGFAVVSMTLSGVLLLVAQRSIPIGTAYAIWTGIGAVGTFFVGVYVFGDALNTVRAAAITLIVVGTVGLKIA
jgi:quaternary ammonium compound-resistance protein SugE